MHILFFCCNLAGEKECGKDSVFCAYSQAFSRIITQHFDTIIIMIQNNYCVIMAGGIGSRFWPFSRNNKPKQFLDFFGTGRSLLQMTVDRFRPVVPIENVLIVTNVIYKDLILEQLPDLRPEQILCEPARRNTAPCIAYAVARIAALTDKANIVVAPSDHLILQEGDFVKAIQTGLDFVENNHVLLTLGMKPTRPETGYGYIQLADSVGGGKATSPAENSVTPHKPASQESAIQQDATHKPTPSEEIFKVKTFTEKPNLELAKVFMESGEFLWNSGMFLWNLQTIQQAFAQHLPEIAEKFEAGKDKMATADEDAFIQETFPSCPNISIDYGLMEKANNVCVMSADFGWSDLGTWGSLYELSDKDEHANVALKCDAAFYDSKRNIVTLESGKLAVVQGLEGYIIAEADNVLLICKQEDEQHIRQFVNDAGVRFNGKFS